MNHQQNDIRFIDKLEYHLYVQLNKFVNKTLTHELLEDMFGTIYRTMNNIFSKETTFKLSEKAINYISNEYFKCIYMDDALIVSNKTVDEYPMTTKNINMMHVELKELSKKDLEVLSFVFSNADFADKINYELRKRP